MNRIAMLAVVACALGAPVMAQDFPSKPIRLVVGFPPGGTNDINARLVAPKLAEALGVQVIVENRPGADGVLGTDYVGKAAPDGHTIALAGLSPLVLSAYSYAQIPYDAARDFAGITTVAMSPLVLAVHPSLPARSLKELVALAKARPGKIDFALSGAGGITRMVVELLKISAAIDVQHIAYKGAAPGLTDLLGGHVQGMVVDFPILYPYIKSGKLRGIAVTSDHRNPLLPDLPTSKEGGLPDLFAINWHAIVAPAKTPRPVVEKLHAGIVRAASAADAKERWISMGAESMTMASPDAFMQFLREELSRWGKVAKSAGIKAE